MEIVSLVVSSLALLVTVTILLVLLFRKPKTPDAGTLDQKELGALSSRIEQMSKDLKSEIVVSMQDVMLKMGEQDRKNLESNNEKLERFQKSIIEQLDTKFGALNKQVDDKLSEINKKVEEKLSEGFTKTGKTMQDLMEQLGRIDEAQKNLQALSGDVSSLKKVLENNQARGKYGEYQLSAILHNLFGDTEGIYEEQYTIRQLRNGEGDVRADAVVFPKGKGHEFMCIDSKFPFSDYGKMQDAESEEERTRTKKDFAAAVKKHITDIKNKYIIPDKTISQAIMFIPNDGVFAFVHHDCPDVVEYARSQNVIITSPSTLQAMLVTVNLLRIDYERSQRIGEITVQLKRLGKDFEMFGREWETFSKNLSMADRNRAVLDSRVNKITGRFDSISGNSLIDSKDDGGETE